MAEEMGNLKALAMRLHRHRGLILPLAATGLIFAVLVPIPPVLMNVLLVGNITLAAVILLTTIYVNSPLEFSVFPSLLLLATLVRLVLNVATTRLILTAGEGGRSMQEAQLAAGQVIWAFSHFVTAGSLEVGVILFTILAVIQFVVITKGAARVSEVAARFVLDAMPGKQMAIDADLSAGLIDEGQAHVRRQEISRQADFYGAMDGASKFVRGDAVAAVIITLVNITGGLYIGMVRYGWSADQTVGLFTRLTIGDGLVAQIPAFIISVSAALIVTRSASKSNLPEEVIGQLTSRPIVLVIAAGFLASLMFTSLPKAPLLLIGTGCVGLAWVLSRRQKAAADGGGSPAGSVRGAADRSEDQRLGMLLTVDPLRIDLGYALVPLVDGERGADLLGRIAKLRRLIASDLGMVVPSVKIADDMSLEPGQYVVAVRGVKAASGRLHPRRLLAVGGEDTTGELAGPEAWDPLTTRPAVWISHDQKQRAESLNYTIKSPAAILAEHLGEVIRIHAADLLSRQQTSRLMDKVRQLAPDVVTEAIECFGLGKIHKLLQNLLADGVPIRDMEMILETICEGAARSKDVDEVTALVRLALSRALTQRYCGGDGKLWCVSLAPALAEEIRRQADKSDSPELLADSPARARRISEALADGLARLTRHGRSPIVLCDPKIRAPLRKMIAPVMPRATVLAYNEVDSAEVQFVGSVGIE